MCYGMGCLYEDHNGNCTIKDTIKYRERFGESPCTVGEGDRCILEPGLEAIVYNDESIEKYKEIHKQAKEEGYII